MQPVKYYQIGGFQAHLLWRPRDSSSDAVAKNLMQMFREPLPNKRGELVLGIRPNGASYLLLPVDRYRERRLDQLSGRYPRSPPWDADAFESLSPIQFGEQKDLEEKLSSYLSNKKSKDRFPRDRSKANTEYTAGGEGLAERGEVRSGFEHQRLLYRLLQNTISRPGDYAISLAPWFNDLRVYSFAFNLWGMDTRALDERKASPQVLDVGWTEFDAPTDSDDLRAVSTTHLTVEANGYLGNPGKTRLALPNITQAMPRDSISILLQKLFAPKEGEERGPPKLLLVHDKEMTMSVLHSFGVDTSKWSTGIKHLLYNSGATNGSRRDTQHDVQSDRRGSYDSKFSRERSRSPRRQPADGPPVRRPCSPPTRRVEAPPVYIVDVRVMYQYLRRIPSDQDDSVPLNATALRVRDTALQRGEDDEVIYEDIDLKQWCAGRESRLLGYMWEDMANGVAIDEQRAYRDKLAKDAELYAPAPGCPGQVDEDDVDPNDIIQPLGARPGQSQPKPSGMFDSDDDDW